MSKPRRIRSDPWRSWSLRKYREILREAARSPMYRERLKRQVYWNIEYGRPGQQACMYWLGEMPQAHRGQMHGRHWVRGIAVRPYRFLWDLEYGYQPGKVLRHMCCSKGQCCNLGHLRLGDAFDNHIDRYSQTLGYRGPHISEILYIYETGKNPAPQRIPRATIRQIVLGKTYYQVTADTEAARRKRIKWGLPADAPKPKHREINL